MSRALRTMEILRPAVSKRYVYETCRIRAKSLLYCYLSNTCSILPDTQFLLPFPYLLAILEEGMRNLVKETGVTSTRSHYYTKPENLLIIFSFHLI